MVRIITDTTSCIPRQFAQERHISVMPQVVIFGEESYYDDSQIDSATFMSKLKSSKELPKTAAPPPELFVAEFERLIPLGEPILCIHPSEKVSGTDRSAVVAAKEFPGADIRIIDTRVIASPVYSMVQKASDWAV